MTEITITVEDAVLEWLHSEVSKPSRSVSQFVGDMLAEKMALHARSAHAIEMQKTLSFESAFFELGCSSRWCA